MVRVRRTEKVAKRWLHLYQLCHPRPARSLELENARAASATCIPETHSPILEKPIEELEIRDLDELAVSMAVFFGLNAVIPAILKTSVSELKLRKSKVPRIYLERDRCFRDSKFSSYVENIVLNESIQHVRYFVAALRKTRSSKPD